MTPLGAPADPSPSYAVVVVHADLSQRGYRAEQVDDDLTPEDPNARTWHYRIPPAMRGRVLPGQLVWVPFGKQYLQGLVVALDDHSVVSEAATRDLDQIVDPEPILSAAHLELARWISAYYLAPLYRVIQNMLPPGITQTTETLIALNPEASTANLTELKTQIVELLRAQGPLVERQIGRLSGVRTWRDHVRQLVSAGVLSSQVRLRPPAVRPKLEPVVRLAPDADAQGQLSASATRQREVLTYVQRRGRAGRWVPISEITGQTGASTNVVRALCDKGLLERDAIQVWRDPLAGQAFVPVVPPALTPSQGQVWEVIARDLDAPAGKPFLLQGVTGSGKTEIYLRAVERVLEQGRGAIILVPEIALTPQTIRRFGARFPETIAVMHSGLLPGERFDQWHRIRAGELRLVVGARSAIFSPVRSLGLIVLDEEHEWTYKQDVAPHYHTRDVAVRLASLCGATCILGSATPALESAYLAERGAFVLLHMPERVMGHRRVVEEQSLTLHRENRRYLVEAPCADASGPQDAVYTDLPPVEVVDMRAELRAGNTSMLSRGLHQALTSVLAAGEQAILFLNRRGSATFVMCRDCGHVLSCPRCDVPLTYHGAQERLVCHHCAARYQAPAQCPACRSKRIRYFGAGTQRVEEVVQTLFPQTRVVRWDTDTVEDARSHQAILDRFIRGEADVMVGTQMVAKGLDLPRVTLVGVITADTLLHLPDFRSSERTFQLLTQVAGRAGRSILGGKVIIQTYTPEHPAIAAASHHDYEVFYRQEIAFRRQHWYPPLSQMIRLLYVSASAPRAAEEAQALHALLQERIARLGLADLDLVGPAPAFFARIKGLARWHILVRGSQPHALLRGLVLPLGWRVDVDPVSVL
jgi:primosomal protein N' (replication factor Y)